MKIVKLSDSDHTLLAAAAAKCAETEAALDEAFKLNKAAQTDHQKLLSQLMHKAKLQDGGASEDNRYLYGSPVGPPED